MAFFRSPNRPNRRQTNKQLDFTQLEPRQLLAITFNSANGHVAIAGTGGDDTAAFVQLDSLYYQAQLNGATQNFSINDVNKVFFYGQSGDDTFENQTNVPVDAYGGSGNDILTGGGGADLVYGGDDNDQVNGGGGNDVVSGSNGNDTIRGGEGNDRLFGISGTNDIYGDGGNDALFGGNGVDTLYGGSGVDSLRGYGGNDFIYGNDGNDYAVGGDGDDSIEGNDGNDILVGNDGDDYIDGGAGEDLILGMNNNDELYGGGDYDRIFGGDGNDLISGDGGADRVNGNNGDDIIYGGDGDDILQGGNDNDTIYGGADDDMLFGDAGDDRIEGDGGNDRVWGGDGADYILGGDGDDRLNGLGGNDRIYGEAGLDIARGGAGNDGLFGGIGGGDRVVGNEGSDRFLIWAGDTMVDRNELEAQLEFKSETSDWNEAEIRVIDDGLHMLMELAGTSLILRDSLDPDPVVYSKWSDLNGAAGINSLRTSWYWTPETGYVYDYTREIKFIEFDENHWWYSSQFALIAIHEVGHSWDSAAEINNVFDGEGGLWDDFLAISQWTDVDPQSSDYTASHDGQWWYHNDSTFASNYARTNPREDFAETVEAYFNEYESAEERAEYADKLAIFADFMALFQNHETAL